MDLAQNTNVLYKYVELCIVFGSLATFMEEEEGMQCEEVGVGG